MQWLPWLMLVSGACALAYEVVWTRQFANFIGASSISVTIVLASLMGGLGLGSWAVGAWVDRLGPRALVRALAACEAALALYALAMPQFIELASALYFGSVDPDQPNLALRAALVAVLVVLPCLAMGASLPLASRLMPGLAPSGGPSQGAGISSVSRLYACNTLGAALGTLITGYVLLAWLGNSGAVAVAATGSLAVAAVLAAWPGLATHWPASRAPVPMARQREAVAPPWSVTVLLGMYGLSGAVAMALQVAWVRSLEMTLGTTTYAFTTMLAAFLAGVMAGSAVFPRLARRVAAPRLLVALLMTVCVGALVSGWLMDQLPMAYFWLLQRTGADWTVMHLVRLLLALSTMLLPTFAMGLLFPLANDLATQAWATRQRAGQARTCAPGALDTADASGRSVAQVFAVNAAGGALGASLAGLWLVPTVGMQRTIVACALLSAGLAVGMVLLRRGLALQPRLNQMAVVLAAALVALTLVSPWQHRVLSGGMYLYFQNYARAAALRPDANPLDEVASLMKHFELQYWRSGPTATVTVMRSPLGVTSLMINGKVDASASPEGMGSDMKTQTALGLLPALLSERHEQVYVVGLGSGVTAGALLDFDVGNVRVSELAPAVVGAARLFREHNHDVVDHPRVRLVAEDARHDLSADSRSYDLIVTQPSNLWIAGESGLYTREWYDLLASRLAPGGLVAQWLPAYNISPRNLAVVLNTLRQRFASVTLWRTGERGDLLAIASPQRQWQPTALARAGQRLAANASLAQAVQRLGLPQQPAAWLYLDEAGVDAWLRPFGADLDVNTDDHTLTEFTTPRDMFEKRRVDDLLH